ncbi:MAG: Vitamin B12 transporter BtuB [Alphaproteobacteria bacterium MarineAlpha2_Bin1]|nr:MAG: Vitamin B12 transporter BtuB [Alphaproteobacteria bacterium MarineAlpha2_Bin1]|tara:strand:- start:24 stop:1961 length:1938 start_codon:yes stop_codon:yes gene_type:complete
MFSKKCLFYYQFIFILIASVYITKFAIAEEYYIPEEIFVTATRINTPSKKIGSPISIIDSIEIDKMQFTDLSEALSQVPGLNRVSIGNMGHQTSIFIRGTNSNHSLILIDGIEMGDPSASSGAFDYGNVFLGMIDRLEVLRGSQASTYGSEAIGGVVNIITPVPSANYFTYKMSLGTNSSHRENLEISRVFQRIKFISSLSFNASDGDSITSSRFRGAGTFDEKDSFENVSGSLRLNLDLYDSTDLNFIFHYFDTKAELDPTAEDPDANSTSTQYFTKLEVSSFIFDGFVNNIFSVNLSKINREFFNYPDQLSNTFQSTLDDGERVKLNLRSDILFFEDHILSLGFEYEHEKQDNTQFADFSGFIIEGSSSETSVTKTVFLQDTFSFSEYFHIIGDLRYDKNKRFKGDFTYRFSPVFYINSINTRLRGAYGTGFRAPALFELFGSSTTAFGDSFRGNRDLSPEKSKSWELGFDSQLFDDNLFLGITYFDTKIDDLIVASGFPTVPIHSLNAKINGIETQATIIPNKKIKINLSHTFTSAENKESGTALLRRPKHKVDFNLEVFPLEKLEIINTIKYIGKTSDVGFNGGSVYRGGYIVSNIVTNYKVNDNLTIYGKIYNLTDNNYEVADGFKGQDRSLHLGFKKIW